MIYMDHNATTQMRDEVRDAMFEARWFCYGNASSLHTAGRKAREAIDKARSIIASAIGANPEEIIFTSGGTESDNLAIQGVLGPVGKGMHAVTSPIEHHAVLKTIRLCRLWWKLDQVKVSGDGVVDLDDLRDIAKLGTVSFCSIMHSNNEIGAIQPISEVSEIVKSKRREAILHVDAVQSFGKVPLHVDELGVDLMSISAHKLYGPKGIGALYVRKGTPINPMILGGNQERGMRAGTENVPGIVGFGEAVRIAMRDLDDRAIRECFLAQGLIMSALRDIPDTWLNGGFGRLPNTVNVGFKGVDAEALLLLLDNAGIMASSGAACESGKVEPSHVLKAMGLSDTDAKSCVRFSIGRSTTLEDIEAVITALKAIVPALRGIRDIGAAPGEVENIVVPFGAMEGPDAEEE